MADDKNPEVPQEPGGSGSRDRLFEFLRGRSQEPPADEKPDAVPDCEPVEADEENPNEWAFFRALDGVPPLCPHCGNLCKPHVIRVRDATMHRGAQLAGKMVQWIRLYFDARELGQDEPGDTIDEIYRLWDELCYLGEAVEPQEPYGDEDEDED